VALAAGGSPAGACACGIAIDAEINAERALVIEHHHGESIVLSLELADSGEGGRGAVVVPVPAAPTVAALEQGDPLAYLERATAPPVASSAGAGDETAGAGVDVIGREQIGGYDVARLGAADGAALRRWLDAHGYVLPDGAEPILSDYADEDWRFVAIRLAPKSDGSLKPLKISFDTEQTVYPMRLEQLATAPVYLTLFVLAPGERRVKGLERTFSAPVDKLEPAPPASVAELFGSDDHVTRIEVQGAEPSKFKRDLAIEKLPAPPGASGPDQGGLSTLGFVLVAAAGLVALLVALAIKLRREPVAS
jgi:hypothetical protein